MIAIHAANVGMPTTYEAIRLELASGGLEPKRLPKTTPKNPHGIAPMSVTYRICSMGRFKLHAAAKANAGWSAFFRKTDTNVLARIWKT